MLKITTMISRVKLLPLEMVLAQLIAAIAHLVPLAALNVEMLLALPWMVWVIVAPAVRVW